MSKFKLLAIGTPVFFAVQDDDGNVTEKEGEIVEVTETDPAYKSGGPTYEIRVHAERRVYNSVPADVVRELTAASGVEDGEYGFSAEDVERDFLNAVESLWYGMDPRGDEHTSLDKATEELLLRALNEDDSGFFIDNDNPPEDEDDPPAGDDD